MKRLVLILLVGLPGMVLAENEAFRPLADSIVAAVGDRDFVKFVKCFPENTEFFAHLKSAERSPKNITLADVNQKLADRHKTLSQCFAKVLQAMEEANLTFDSLRIASLSVSGPRPGGKEMNLLKIELTDKGGKKLLLLVHDLVLVGDRWLVGDKVTAQTE